MAINNVALRQEFTQQRAGEPDAYKTQMSVAAGVSTVDNSDRPAGAMQGASLTISASHANPGVGIVSGANGEIGEISPLGAFEIARPFEQAIALSVMAGQPDGVYVFYTSVAPLEDV